MALSFLADIEAVSSDLSTAFLVDLTIYGGSNPARNTLALYLYFAKRDASSNDTSITVDNTDPENVVQWQFDLPEPDGLFVGSLFGFDIWAAGAYLLNACVYYAVNGNYYIANTNTSGVPGVSADWTLITDIQSTCTGNTSVEQSQFYAWSTAHSSSGPLADAEAALGQMMISGKCKDWAQAAQVLTGAGLLESAFVNFRRGDYVQAQEIADFVQMQTSSTI